MQHEAETASVTLPPRYGFSFEAQRVLVKFDPGGLGLLAQQLGEVKTISEILFAARRQFDWTASSVSAFPTMMRPARRRIISKAIP